MRVEIKGHGHVFYVFSLEELIEAMDMVQPETDSVVCCYPDTKAVEEEDYPF